jgi:glycosyltransferase involved in cell wall biosynthesis
MTYKILLIENSARDFHKSRLDFALYLKSKGWDVYVMIPLDVIYTEMIHKEGICVISYHLDRKNKSLFQMLKLFSYYKKIITDHHFDFIHSFRFQPNFLNIFFGLSCRSKSIIHITGLGIVFSNNMFKFRILRFLSQFIYLIKFFLVDKVIFQNPDDIRDVFASKYFRNKVFLVPGSGVDIHHFDPIKYDKMSIRDTLNISINDVLFICVTRLLWEKGISELVEAFEEIKFKFPNFRLLIVGSADIENPSHVNSNFIDNFNQSNSIMFLGDRNDIPELLSASDYFILPSYYREGIPRSILEALSMGLPIITTDMPGCRMTVENSNNGILIKPKSVNEIINGLELIISMNRKKLGLHSRRLAVEKFQSRLIYEKIECLYK